MADYGQGNDNPRMSAQSSSGGETGQLPETQDRQIMVKPSPGVPSLLEDFTPCGEPTLAEREIALDILDLVDFWVRMDISLYDRYAVDFRMRLSDLQSELERVIESRDDR